MTDHHSGTYRTRTPFTEDCAFVQEHLEAASLDILEPADHARAERHLQLCGHCRRDLAALHQVTDLLPLLSEPASPSPRVRARLFERIAEESEPGPHLVSFGSPWSNDASPDTASTPRADSAGGDTPAWRTWMMPALFAPLAITLIILAAWTSSLRNDLESARSGETRDAAARIATGTGTSGMRLYSMEPSCPTCDDSPASGHLGVDPDETVGLLVAWNLDPNEQHEVWCEDRDGTLIRVSDLDVERGGQVAQTVNFPDAIGGYRTIYVARIDGTEEMRVALDDEEDLTDDATPEDDPPEGE